jgi:hypothetical protein
VTKVQIFRKTQFLALRFHLPPAQKSEIVFWCNDMSFGAFEQLDNWKREVKYDGFIRDSNGDHLDLQKGHSRDVQDEV